MNVKEFKEFLSLFDDRDSIADILKIWLRSATEQEVEIVGRASFEKLNHLMVEHKIRSKKLEQQLVQTKMYLKGEMYKDEETAKEMLYKQIDNIERVLGK